MLMNMFQLLTRYYRAHPPNPSYRERTLQLVQNETVMVHVDVQGEFLPSVSHEDGNLEAEGLGGFTFGWPNPGEASQKITDVLVRIEAVTDAARRAGLVNVFVKHAHQKDLSDASGEWSDMHERTHGLKIGETRPGLEHNGGFWVNGSSSTELPGFYKPDLGDIAVRKHRFSAFYETELDDILRNMGISNIIFTGFMVNGCVLATMFDAFQRGYRVVLIRDCTTAAEHIDSAEQRVYYQVGVRFTEGWMGYSCTHDDFLKAVGVPDEL
jgi:ureidoacrylate peracid hydrolase